MTCRCEHCHSFRTDAAASSDSQAENGAPIHAHEQKHEHGHNHEHEHNHPHGHGHEHAHGHDHGHDHGHGEEENRGRMIARLIGAAVLLAAGLFFPENSWLRLALSLGSALCAGYDVLLGSVTHLIHGQVLDELFLMSAASAGAFALGEYTEGALVLLLFQLGEFLQDLAVDRSRGSIAELMNIRPDTATVLRDGQEMRVHPEEVAVGETILIRPGERIPLDGMVTEGESFLDTSVLTGESVPRSIRPGEEALSGCVNQRGLLRMRVTRPYGDSTVHRILELVENATEHKSHADRFITRFARIYTPVVVGAAAALFLIGALLTGQGSEWLRRALTFLVISCPCALVISVPLSYFNGIGRASRKGILVKGSDILEQLSRTGAVAFDKTGTMTRGVFEVVAVHPQALSEAELLTLVRGAEKYSTHPIADAIRVNEAEGEHIEVSDPQEIAGQGVTATVNGHRVAAGNSRLMAAEGVEAMDCHLSGTIVHIAVDGEYAGHLVISDVIRESAGRAVAELKSLGIRKTVMLTGDRAGAAEDVGKQIGVDEVFAELRPEDKVAHVRRIMEEKKAEKETVLFVGDGINDAPVLASADLGAAMGGAGTDAAVEAADLVLLDDDPVKIPEGIRLARRTQRIVTENIVLSILIKAAVMVLGAFGVVPLWLAVFSDVGVCLLAILNAMR